MESNAMRAIFIGVSIFVAIMTLTLVIRYYNTAKDTAGAFNKVDLSVEYDKYVQEIVQKNPITGTDLRYIIIYYANNPNMKVNIIDSSITVTKENVNGTDSPWISDTYKNIYMEKWIRPNYKYTLQINSSTVPNVITATFQN